MKLQYLGTAAAEGIPAIFCNCKTCQEARKRGGRNFRTRSQALIDGKLMIDYPADAYAHMLKFGINMAEIRHILFTHTHSDHFYPPDMLNRIPGYSSLGTSPEEKLHFYGAGGTMLRMQSFIAGYLLDVSSCFGFTELKPYTENHVGEYTVIPLEGLHDVKSFPLIYLIRDAAGKTLLYAHDTNYFADHVWTYFEKNPVHIDFASLDCTDAARPQMHYVGHMNLNDNVKVRDRLISLGCADDKTMFCSNHFSHNGEDVLYEEFSRHAADVGFLCSYDGMEIEF